MNRKIKFNDTNLRIIRMKGIKITALALCSLMQWSEGMAQKIDFDMTGRRTEEVTESGFQSWQVAKGASATAEFAADGTRKVTISVDCGNEANRSLRANWSKNIVQQSSKLLGDALVVYGLDENGNTPQLTSESATMNITASGLAKGNHTLLAYMNATDGNLSSMAPIDALVDDKTAQSGIIMSNQALSTSAAGFAYIEFEVADENTPVRFSFISRPQQGKTYSTSGIYVNALVFDQASPANVALEPYPANEDMHAEADNGTIRLSWKSANGTKKSTIYVGTSADDMKLTAETADEFYSLQDLSTHNTYYWRVDQTDANGKTYKGDTWSFRPRRLAFPGAEGYGRYAIGGRGGSVYHVTRLDDYADGEQPIPGSFRYGIKEMTGPRTIVFDVAGTISLKARLTCSAPCVTIAGQTAPGKGILFRGAPIGMASDGITRFVRMRRGFHNDDEADISKGLDGLGMAGNDHSIMDHCSVGWTIDEAFSSRNAKNITLQRTLISEALNKANHPNYDNASHGFAATIGGDTGSYHHNLLAHNEGRNWSLAGGLDGKGAYAGRHDVFNNVVYNWGGRATDGGTHECNFVGNYYKMGPATSQKVLLKAQLEGTGTGSQSYYVSGNVREDTSGKLTQDKKGNTYTYTTSGGQKVDWTVFVSNPFFESFATVETAGAAYKSVLSDVGANEPRLDDHDTRVIKETLEGTYTYKGSKTGKKGLIDRETDAGGYEDFPQENRSADYDTDQDGMPDWWETATGHDPLTADNNSYADANGYTALEEYLNWLAEPHFTVYRESETETANTAALFAGFGSGASFSVASETDGYSARVDGERIMITVDKNAAELGMIAITATAGDKEAVMRRTLNIYAPGNATNGITSAGTNGRIDVPCRVFSADGRFMGYGTDLSQLPHGIYIIRYADGGSKKAAKR